MMDFPVTEMYTRPVVTSFSVSFEIRRLVYSINTRASP